jgi:hypothetical protein
LNVEGFDGFESGSESEEEGEEQTSEVELKYYAQQKGMVQRMMSNYVDKIVSNLEDRFVLLKLPTSYTAYILTHNLLCQCQDAFQICQGRNSIRPCQI